MAVETKRSTIPTSVSLPAELIAKVDAIAAVEHRSRSGQIVAFLADAVSRLNTAPVQPSRQPARAGRGAATSRPRHATAGYSKAPTAAAVAGIS